VHSLHDGLDNVGETWVVLPRAALMVVVVVVHFALVDGVQKGALLRSGLCGHTQRHVHQEHERQGRGARIQLRDSTGELDVQHVQELGLLARAHRPERNLQALLQISGLDGVHPLRRGGQDKSVTKEILLCVVDDLYYYFFNLVWKYIIGMRY